MSTAARTWPRQSQKHRTRLSFLHVGGRDLSTWAVPAAFQVYISRIWAEVQTRRSDLGHGHAKLQLNVFLIISHFCRSWAVTFLICPDLKFFPCFQAVYLMSSSPSLTGMARIPICRVSPFRRCPCSIFNSAVSLFFHWWSLLKA